MKQGDVSTSSWLGLPTMPMNQTFALSCCKKQRRLRTVGQVSANPARAVAPRESPSQRQGRQAQSARAGVPFNWHPLPACANCSFALLTLVGWIFATGSWEQARVNAVAVLVIAAQRARPGDADGPHGRHRGCRPAGCAQQERVGAEPDPFGRPRWHQRPPAVHPTMLLAARQY